MQVWDSVPPNHALATDSVMAGPAVVVDVKGSLKDAKKTKWCAAGP